jgi:predicted HAD superfamily phosphohydrolase YqeG
MRWWYAIKQSWLERENLKRFMTDPTKQIHSLTEVTAQRLDDANIAILVLDFDGVLGPHDAKEPLPEAMQWLKAITQIIGESRVAILTNKPKPARLKFFSEHFPSIFIVQHVPKKPYPDGLLTIAEFKGIPPHRMVLIDDRLLTGMLATCLAYTQGWYFYPPKRNFWRNPVRETFFSLLRAFERTALRCIA